MTTFSWHPHHAIYLLEPDLEPRQTRIAYIVRNKPAKEQPLRLRLYQPVRGPLPEAMVSAGEAWERADAEWDRAYAERERAYAEWKRAYAEHLPAIEALHAVECPDCPWDGKTIFPKAQQNDPML